MKRIIIYISIATAIITVLYFVFSTPAAKHKIRKEAENSKETDREKAHDDYISEPDYLELKNTFKDIDRHKNVMNRYRITATSNADRSKLETILRRYFSIHNVSKIWFIYIYCNHRNIDFYNLLIRIKTRTYSEYIQLVQEEEKFTLKNINKN